MPNLHPLAISLLMTSLTSAFVAILLFIFGKTKLHRLWVIFKLAISWWSFFIFMAVTAIDPHKTYYFWQLAHTVGIYVAVLYFQIVDTFCNLNYRKALIIAYLYGLFFDYFNWINGGEYLYSGVAHIFNSMNYLIAKNLPMTLIMIPWYVYAVFGIFKLWQFYQSEQCTNKTQVKLWLIFTMLGYIGGSSPFLPMLGINIYPFAMFLLPIYVIVMVYVVFRHQFLNLQIVFEKSIVYTV